MDFTLRLILPKCLIPRSASLAVLVSANVRPLAYLVNAPNVLMSAHISAIYSPNASYGLPPSDTCLAIALPPYSCVNGSLNLSPSAFSTYNACMFL